MGIVLSVLWLTPAIATTHMIRPDGTGDFPTIQAGIDASAPGDTVLLEDGIFEGEGNRDLDCRGLPITIRSLGGADTCILDVNYQGRGFHFQNGEPRDCIIEGLTIREGQCWNIIGGGVLCSNGSSPTLRDCVIRECEAWGWLDGHGAGIACVECSAPLLQRCQIMLNVAVGASSAQRGGGVYAESANVRLEHCFIAGNTCSKGAGIFLSNSAAIVDGCVIVGNYGHLGGGIRLENSADACIVNCTIAANRVFSEGGGIHCDSAMISSSILWGNCAHSNPTSDQVYVTGTLLLDCCVVDSAGVGGPGHAVYQSCLSCDPLFCAPALCDSAPTVEGDYRIDATSPCIPENNPCGEWIGALHVGCPLSDIAEDRPVLSRAAIEILPNPTTGDCRIRFYLPTASSAHIDLLDTEGRVVRTLWEGMAAGQHQVTWDGRGADGRVLPAGIYWARLSNGETQSQRSVLLIR